MFAEYLGVEENDDFGVTLEVNSTLSQMSCADQASVRLVMDSVCPNDMNDINTINPDLQSRHKLNLNMIVTDLFGVQ